MGAWVKNLKFTLSNVYYIYRIIWQARKQLIFYSILFVLTTTLAPFVIIIIPKIIIDEITTLQRYNMVIYWAGLMVVLHLIIANLQIFARNFVSLNAKYMMIPMSIMFNKKNMEMDYEYTEDPAVLDEKQKAAAMLLNPGTEETAGSIEGYIFAVNQCMVGILQLILCFLIISTFNVYFVIFLFFTSSFNTFLGMRLKRINHELELSTVPLQRKWNYLLEVAGSFSYGKMIRIFNLADWIHKKGKETCNERFSIRQRIFSNTAKYNSLIEAANTLRLLITYGYLVFRVISAHIGIGDFTMYLNAVSQFASAFEGISLNSVEIRKNDLGIKNYRNFLNKEGIMQRTAVKGVSIKEGPEHTIEFVDVSFKYPRQERYVLKNISLKIRGGEKLSIVGENGAGKTTFVKLLLRLYDVTEGKILLDGIDIRHYSYNDYLKMFSTVFQDFRIYAFTVYENIALAQTDRASKKELDEIIDMGGLSERIKRLKNGGNTYMFREFDETGVELSGGEQQKLALCSSIYRDAPIVILDEPTAMLSPAAEYEVYTNFDKLIGNKTAIYISRRMSSCRFSDSIAVFHQGRIIEYGTHQQLLGLNRHYAKMFNAQADYYKELNG